MCNGKCLLLRVRPGVPSGLFRTYCRVTLSVKYFRKGRRRPNDCPADLMDESVVVRDRTSVQFCVGYSLAG